MPTLFTPLKNEDFNSSSVNFKATGVKGTCPFGTTYNLDYKLPYDCILTGGFLILKDHVYGDTVTQQVVDIDNVLGYGANVVLKEFVTDWNVAEDTQSQPMIVAGYPAKPFENLYLRVKYTSTGATDVKISVNYLLHKVLF